MARDKIIEEYATDDKAKHAAAMCEADMSPNESESESTTDDSCSETSSFSSISDSQTEHGCEERPRTLDDNKHRRLQYEYAVKETSYQAPHPLREHPVEAGEGSPPRSARLYGFAIDDLRTETMVYRRANGKMVKRRMARLGF